MKKLLASLLCINLRLASMLSSLSAPREPGRFGVYHGTKTLLGSSFRFAWPQKANDRTRGLPGGSLFRSIVRV
jgi:hypothetical protein